MNQEQTDRIASLLHRISDRSERDEITREIAKVLEEAGESLDHKRFFHLASVEDSTGAS